MAEYNPKKNRRPATDPDDTADLGSQVDAILDRTSDGDVAALPDTALSDEVLNIESPVVDLRNDPSSSPRSDDRDAGVATKNLTPESTKASGVSSTPAAPPPDRTTQRIAVVAGVAAATTAAIWLLRRSRRQ